MKPGETERDGHNVQGIYGQHYGSLPKGKLRGISECIAASVLLVSICGTKNNTLVRPQ